MRRSCLSWRSIRLCLLLSSVLAACGRSPTPPARRPNIVVVLVDTLRADRLGVYGNRRGLTPFLDSLAQRAVVFHQAYVQAPWTSPSVASLFTSRFQSQHGLVNFASTLAASEITLAEVLREHGYATGAFLANGLVGRHRGFAQGFDEYVALWGQPRDASHTSARKPRADVINGLAEAWLEKLGADSTRRFFLYVHYIEPHSPYTPPDEFLGRVFAGPQRPTIEMVRARMIERFTTGRTDLDPETLRYVQELYDGEVASVDDGIRRLCLMLEERGLLQDAVLVVTADHGEAFEEHGFMGHGGMLCNEVIRVPLLMVLPGQSTRVDVEEPVGLVDIAPTLLDLVGTPAPPSFEGRSLQPALFRARHPWLATLLQGWRRGSGPPPVFSERIVPGEPRANGRVQHERAIVMNGRKLIVSVNGERESFDVVRDPDERTPLARPDDDVLAEALGGFRARVALTTLEAPPIDPELRGRMEALGYVD